MEKADTQSSDLPFPVRLPSNNKVRSIDLTSFVSQESSNLLLRCVRVYNLSTPTRELSEHLVSLTPVERLYQAMKVVMFRLLESKGTAPWPCMAAEEQVFLEEITLSDVPTDVKVTAEALLYIPERTAYARSIRPLVAQLA